MYVLWQICFIGILTALPPIMVRTRDRREFIACSKVLVTFTTRFAMTPWMNCSQLLCYLFFHHGSCSVWGDVSLYALAVISTKLPFGKMYAYIFFATILCASELLRKLTQFARNPSFPTGKAPALMVNVYLVLVEMGNMSWYAINYSCYSSDRVSYSSQSVCMIVWTSSHQVHLPQAFWYVFFMKQNLLIGRIRIWSFTCRGDSPYIFTPS